MSRARQLVEKLNKVNKIQENKMFDLNKNRLGQTPIYPDDEPGKEGDNDFIVLFAKDNTLITAREYPNHVSLFIDDNKGSNVLTLDKKTLKNWVKKLK